ncbi:MAG: glucose-6-phosphate dehydrogenase assembly protein OpcA [Chloroflexota bacterium]
MPASSATRPMAHPIPGASWEGRVTDATAVSRHLARLWADLAAREVASAAGDLEQLPLGVLTRASTLNLTALARSRGDAERAERAVARLGDLYPSRATILLADPDLAPEADADAGASAGMNVRAVLLEQEAARGRGAIRFEEVVVEVSARSERQLASIAAPLLVADLPDFLWWVADTTTGSPLFTDLCTVSDRIIVDSAGAPDPAAELSAFAGVLAGVSSPPRLGDFAWRRLDPWRNLLTGFFDPPATRAALASIDAVEITYGAADRSGRTGFTGAMLLAGWLASRLDWRPPGDLVRAPGGDGWRVTMRAGQRGDHREVSMAVKPAEDPVAGCALASVALSSGAGGSEASFRIERIDQDEIATIARMPGAPTSRRTVYAGLPGDAELLADELRQYGRDGVYEAALACAAVLCPDRR